MELDLLNRKLELARLPRNIINEQWGESNGVSVEFMINTVEYWRTKYNWREEETKINKLPQFQTSIDVDGFGSLRIHFVHSKSSKPNAIPLLFIHGWPGSFIEVSKILPKLSEAGYDVVAPSLPGYGFSSYPDKAGFNHDKHSEFLNKLMQKLGYKKYVVQGGDWGSHIARNLTIHQPEAVRAMHVNMLMMKKPDFEKEPEYTDAEKGFLKRMDWYVNEESAYVHMHETKPRNLGFALHDSPVGMLAWMADKLILWTDNYPWTPDELITWTLLHYFPGPTTGLQMYRENPPFSILEHGTVGRNNITVPSGISAFPKELGVVPRCWAEPTVNVKFWQEHTSGGHFAAYEKPNELFEDVDRFYRSVWKV